METNGTQAGKQRGFSVIIVGAGIAGLATATGLARKGHNVTVLEAHSSLNEFGASIGITPNGVRVLKDFGLEDKFRPFVSQNEVTECRDGVTNKTLGRLAFNKNKNSEISYGAELWQIHRAVYQQLLAEAAHELGVSIMFDARPETVDVENCRVVLKNGRILTADLIVGADGLRSIVRHSIPATSHVEPKALFEQCFRCTVPKSAMANNPQLKEFLEVPKEMIWLGPGAYVLSWLLPNDTPYDVVCCVFRESDVPPGKWGTKADPELMRKDFEQFCPQVRELLKHVDGCVKWTLAELPPLETCRSENGRVTLVGDAFHGMIPHTASGGNSAIEDAACLSECLDWAFNNDKSIAEATAAFQVLRKDRVERMQHASHEGYSFLNAQGEMKAMLVEGLAQQTLAQEAQMARPEEERRADVKAQPDMHARFPTEPYLQWLYSHDTIATASSYLQSQQANGA